MRVKETLALADELHETGVLDEATDRADSLSHPIAGQPQANTTGSAAQGAAPAGPMRVKETLGLAEDMRGEGVLNDEVYRKITLREFRRSEDADIAPGAARSIYPQLTGDEIRGLRERSKMSQAVFARLLNLTVGYVSQLERGVKRPTGSTLALLDVIGRKGIEGIL